MQVHPPDGPALWAARGYPDATPLAVGMEAAAYRLGGNLVGKIYGARSAVDLRLLQACYADAAHVTAASGLQIPEILDIDVVDGTLISVERELPGRPLAAYLPPANERAVVPDAVAQALLSVLRALAPVSPTPAMRGLQVLDEPTSPWSDTTSWSEAMQRLAAVRLARFGPQLAARVDRFENKVAGLQRRLSELEPERLCLVHGDLVPENVLVDEDLQPVAVLDFGFLSTAGDPAFDAAVTARIFNMYGGDAASVTRSLRDLFADELGHDRRSYLVYDALYAMTTSNAYDADGGDGHFAWCAAVLDDPDVADVLLD